LVPYFLIAYRATPNSVTGYSPFYLFHGREMEIPNNDNFKARVETGNTDVDLHIRKLKANLKKPYELVAKLNGKSHQRYKNLYDHRAKARNFEVDVLVYLYNPKMKVGLTTF
jgi:hypothetical protein